MGKVISGIQQIGIGIPRVQEAFDWYRKAFGVDLKIFEEAAEAKLMLRYTGGEPQSRHAILAMNIQSGGGFEIWQYVGRIPQPAAFDIALGDLGIYICKIKSKDVNKTFQEFENKDFKNITPVSKLPDGRLHFYMNDPYGNIFEIVEGYGWFKDRGVSTGAVFGAVIGVTDIEKSKVFYKNILGYDTVVFDATGVQTDMSGIPGADRSVRRVVLKHSEPRKGAFSKILGPSEIELVQLVDAKPRKIFENRFWGDLGFIHLCFDVANMPDLKSDCEKAGHPFTVDSGNSFDMGEAAGQFAYIEDPDGTLIEFVETHKVPIMKKFGIYLNLKNRNPEKPLHNLIVSALSIHRVK